MSIRPGDIVITTTATGQGVRLRALGTPAAGRDFPVVWVATEDEFWRAEATKAEPEGIPWPLAAITAVERAPA